MRQFLLDLAAGESPLAAGHTVRLSASESSHLLRVLRKSAGDPLDLTDGEGQFYRGILVGREGARAVVRIQKAWQDPEEKQLPLILACAVVKGRRFEWALEKSVELGAQRILPMRTDRTVVNPGEGRQERWLTILRSSLKQCGRSYLPHLFPVKDLPSCLADLRAGLIFYGHWSEEAPATPLTRSPEGLPPTPPEVVTAADAAAVSPVGGWRSLPPIDRSGKDVVAPGHLAWVVGPEGGWTDRERAEMTAVKAVPLSLGPHRLRTETAAIAGLAVLQAWRQEWLAGR